jgi:phospholysine phosphohistidine inorganic pyrophosphate phosphatase
VNGAGLQGILFDLDGVVYLGDAPIEGAVATLDWVRQNKIPHLFVTNTTSRPRAALCSKLAGMGVEVSEDHILSPPVAAGNWLKSRTEGAVALFVPEATQAEFADLPLWRGEVDQPVGAVVLGDLGEGWDFRRLNRAFMLLMQEPEPDLVALGMTRYWQAPDGLRLDAGPFVAALEYATGRQAVVMGKPSRAFFHSGADMLGIAPERLLMIGDDIRGDVNGAQDAGLKGALVKTGKFQPRDLEARQRADLVFGSIAELPQWWQAGAG